MLTGGTVVAALMGERLNVRGPGALDREAPGGAGETTRLTWTTSLSYDGATGEAEALGETLTTSATATERRRIEAGDVRATFEPEAADGPGAESVEPSSGFANLRRLRASAPAGGGNPQVVVVSETLDADGDVALHPPGRGPEPRPRRAARGGGRPPAAHDARPRQADSRRRHARRTGGASGGDTPAVRLAGRGATFFRWVDALRLDGQTRDAELSGSVFMNHDARDGSPRVKLYGDRLLASFAAEGEAEGEAAGVEAAPGEAELQRVQIDGNVVVEQETRVITADHLRYLTDTEEVQLWGSGGRGVSITEDGRTARAGAVDWNLRTNRVDIREAGGGSQAIR